MEGAGCEIEFWSQTSPCPAPLFCVTVGTFLDCLAFHLLICNRTMSFLKVGEASQCNLMPCSSDSHASVAILYTALQGQRSCDPLSLKGQVGCLDDHVN